MVNVVLDAKNQSFKLCSVDGVDVVSVEADTTDFLKPLKSINIYLPIYPKQKCLKYQN